MVHHGHQPALFSDLNRYSQQKCSQNMMSSRPFSLTQFEVSGLNLIIAQMVVSPQVLNVISSQYATLHWIPLLKPARILHVFTWPNVQKHTVQASFKWAWATTASLLYHKLSKIEATPSL